MGKANNSFAGINIKRILDGSNVYDEFLIKNTATAIYGGEHILLIYIFPHWVLRADCFLKGASDTVHNFLLLVYSPIFLKLHCRLHPPAGPLCWVFSSTRKLRPKPRKKSMRSLGGPVSQASRTAIQCHIFLQWSGRRSGGPHQSHLVSGRNTLLFSSGANR